MLVTIAADARPATADNHISHKLFHLHSSDWSIEGHHDHQCLRLHLELNARAQFIEALTDPDWPATWIGARRRESLRTVTMLSSNTMRIF